MKKLTKLLIIFFSISLCSFNSIYAAGTSSGDGNKYDNLYKEGKKLVHRAKKLEKKNKKQKAEKLYIKALNKFEKAYAKDKKNADILNYLGYTLRKTGDFKKAEIFYLKGLSIDAGHLGINEYLGELYVQTNRIELAKKRLAVLSGCDCEEFKDLKKLIENN
jgi:tetratricopeptide (TPR) repeat protein